VGGQAAGREGRARGYDGLAKLHEAALLTWDRDFLLDLLSRGPRGLRWPASLARRSTEGVKPDAEREPGYQERDLARMRDQLERDQKRYAEAADRRLLRSWVKRALALPAGQRIAAADAAFAGATDDAALDARIASLYGSSRVFDLAARKAMFDETPEALRARRDPLLDLGFALDAERKALKDRRDAAAGAVLRLRPAWRKAVVAEAGRPLAPDANGTLRVTFGRVRGYAPREAVRMTPRTTSRAPSRSTPARSRSTFPPACARRSRAGRVGRWATPGSGQVPGRLSRRLRTRPAATRGAPPSTARGASWASTIRPAWWENVATTSATTPTWPAT